MKIYTIEYIYENGEHYTRYFEEEDIRDDIFDYDKKHGPQICIRKRNYEEITDNKTAQTHMHQVQA